MPQEGAIPGPVAGRYVLIERVGKGSMSTVYRAHDRLRDQRVVAVKLLNSEHGDELRQELFSREVRALSCVNHPHIVEVLDSGWSEIHQCSYLVLEYLPRTLVHLIEEHRHDPDHSWCWPLMRDMASALAHAHSEGIVHRDVKPSNVLLAADGSAHLADFGISWLRYELSQHGITVSSFWSIGYAAPEQRSAQQADERSDIYSLGCVFYHMFSRREPPRDGLTSELVRGLSGVPKQVLRVLERMLATDPAHRTQKMTEVCRQLEITRNLELLPEVFLKVTDQARRDLYTLGLTENTLMETACQYLLEEELGGDNPHEVRCMLEREGAIRLYTETLRLICKQDQTLLLLAVAAVHAPYQAQFAQQKEQASPVRYLWQVIGEQETRQIPPSQYAELKHTLTQLVARLSQQASQHLSERKKIRERRDFLATWSNVLAYLREQLDAVPQLRYTSRTYDAETVAFVLAQPVPDDLNWPPNAPIIALNPEQANQVYFVGHVMSSSGKTIEVSRDAGDVTRALDPPETLPPRGIITVFQQEATVALERLERALDLLLWGGTANPRMPEVLRDLAQAAFLPIDERLHFFQPELGVDQQQAVRQALSTQDLFLLQGPPGTGKTTTLAEIVLQILRKTPNARILITSQSNVAVNHLITRIAELPADQPIEIVRVGRAEKIGHGAQAWIVDQRLADWREQILAKTETVLQVLQERVTARRQAHRAQRSEASEDTLLLSQQWLKELDPRIQSLNQQAQSKQEAEEQDLWETLDLIRQTLPEEARPSQADTLAEEHRRLTAQVTRLLSPQFPGCQEEDLVALVKQWRRIFGRDFTFARPILERASVLASTCQMTGGYYLKEQQFDWVIIDEAGRATTAELLVPLVRARKAILVGDERQLPPMLDEALNEQVLSRLGTNREELTQSLFASLVAQAREENLPSVQMLATQFRMHPAIGKMVSTVFYQGQLTHQVSLGDRAHHLPWLERPVAWLTTSRLPEAKETRRAKSYYNRVEIQAISTLLHRMERTYLESEQHRTVAVITPYNAQIVELQAEILPGSSFWRALTIDISTIDAIQGMDRDIVIYSTVRSNPEGQIGFLRDRRRLNVALSRARQALLLVGDIMTLERGRAGALGNPYQELIRYLRSHPEECWIAPLSEKDLVPHG
ncbi:MAG: protein kinase [Ktedonobacteraceae bacterium]|nr:protein kinase [Ktedonobacteraceae bacterium]